MPAVHLFHHVSPNPQTFTEAAFGPGALGRHSQLRAGRASAAELGQRGAGLRHAVGHGAASHGESGQRGDAAGAPHWEGGKVLQGVRGPVFLACPFNTTHFWDVLLEGSVRFVGCHAFRGSLGMTGIKPRRYVWLGRS